VADRLMYGAKGRHAGHVYPIAVRIEDGRLVEIAEGQAPPTVSFRRSG
jgi:hypothetical protein